VITELGVGEALVSVLDSKGTPTQVERTLIAPPRGRIGPLSDSERTALLASSSLAGRYDEVIDRESAHERLEAQLTSSATAQVRPQETPAATPDTTPPATERDGSAQAAASRDTEHTGPVAESAPRSGGRQRQGVMETLLKSVMRALGSQLGRTLIRSLLRSFTRR